MTTPMVETVRTIPLIVEKDLCEPMDAEPSGFPFDQEDRGDDHFRSQLDDIAKRHPEFAEHFEEFPFRSGTLGRNRRPPRPSEQDFRRFADRPFGSSRFGFGFPFNDPFEEQPTQAPPTEPPQPKPEEEKPKPERGRKQNIQPSNTVDLGQKQEPVNDRNQRSMSAPPPDNRQRYVSSIHIPINRDGGMGEMGKAQSQQQPQEKSGKPTERVIPIHVEGRDEPVMPKHSGPSFSQPQPQPERIFGQSPSHFTQFVGREPPKQYQAGPEWHHAGFGPEVKQQQKFQQAAPPPQQQKFQQAAPPQQQKFQQQEIPVQKPQEQVPPEPQGPRPNTPIDLIQSIQKDVSELMGQVEKFNGAPKDKQYIYLDEMLTRNLIKLDDIDTQGQENIRQARKEAIKCIQSCISILEAKAAANVAQATPQHEASEAAPEQPQNEEPVKMEVEEKKDEVEEAKEQEPKPEEKVEPPTETPEEKMEVASEPVPEVSKEEPKPQEPQVSEEIKPDEEMKETENTETETNIEEDAASDDKKEKKKGKKKVVKK